MRCHLITPRQIRAGRMLLDPPMSQKDLATQVGVSADLISKLERGDTAGSTRTLQSIEAVLTDAGVEFTDNEGVCQARGGIREYRGRAGFVDFIYDVYETAKLGNARICVSNVNERDFVKWEGDEAAQYQAKMAELKNVHSRILIEEGDTFFSASEYAECRWTPKTQFGNIPVYIYGDKAALIDFEEDDVSVFVIKHAKITEFWRTQFNLAWENGLIPVLKPSFQGGR